MREWLVYSVSGAMTALGVVSAASGCDTPGAFYGTFVLVLIAALDWMNTKLFEEEPPCCEK